MLYAKTSNGDKVRATPGVTGTCPGCADSLIPKCGEILIWHWSHRAKPDCDSWYEPETDWHLGWKACFPADQVEVTMGPHRADTVSHATVLEFQHSPISPAEIRERERFYTEWIGRMLWVVDASMFKGNLDLSFPTHYEPTIDDEQRAALATVKAFLDPSARLIGVTPNPASAGWTTFRWRHPRRHHYAFTSPLYWDLGNGELLRVLKLEDGSGEGQLLSRAEFLAWFGGQEPDAP